MSNVHVGPKIFKYFEGGKIEEYLGEKRHFEWFENEGCIECKDEAVLKQTAVLLARMHYAPHSQIWILILKSIAISYDPYEHIIESKPEGTLNKISKPTTETLFFWNIKLEFNHRSKTWSNILS